MWQDFCFIIRNLYRIIFLIKSLSFNSPFRTKGKDWPFFMLYSTDCESNIISKFSVHKTGFPVILFISIACGKELSINNLYGLSLYSFALCEA